jgi:hypothetical protein
MLYPLLPLQDLMVLKVNNIIKKRPKAAGTALGLHKITFSENRRRGPQPYSCGFFSC